MARALDAVGATPSVVRSADDSSSASRLVLPGVGRFGEVMRALHERGFDAMIRDHVAAGRPFLGVCVGLQVLFDGSDEDPAEVGMGLVAGRVVRFDAPKVPQVGFNLVEPVGKGVIDKSYYYFVNSYHVVPEERGVVAAESDYHGVFTAAISVGSMLALQFHPEKSGSVGLALLRRWLAC